ncbi:MAG: hypothetical protein WBV94_04470 [Blastocatellia bacterium]
MSISVGFGIGLIIEGIAAGAFLLVFANMAEDIIEIRKSLSK